MIEIFLPTVHSFFFFVKNVWYFVKLFRLDCNALIRYIFYAFFKALYADIHFVNGWIENNAEQGLTHSFDVLISPRYGKCLFLYMDISVKTTSDVLMHTHSVAV